MQSVGGVCVSVCVCGRVGQLAHYQQAHAAIAEGPRDPLIG